jgi:transglutaminase/protease-like cytokinesis protein 3
MDTAGPSVPPRSPIRNCVTPKSHPLGAPLMTDPSSILMEYNSKVGEVRSIERELRTLQAIHRVTERLSSSEDSVHNQIQDAMNRLNLKKEEMNFLKDRCLECGVDESPRESSDSSHIESYSELELQRGSDSSLLAADRPKSLNNPFAERKSAFQDTTSTRSRQANITTGDKSANTMTGDEPANTMTGDRPVNIRIGNESSNTTMRDGLYPMVEEEPIIVGIDFGLTYTGT